MRKVILYIAMSLDGYIADSGGGVGWLSEYGGSAGDDGYQEFAAEVDTVVMGMNTYRQITTELSPDEWPYGGMRCFVMTHSPAAAPQGEAVFTDLPPSELVRRLRKIGGRDIWICGGAETAQALISEDLVDVYRITVVPVILGAGLRLFGGDSGTVPLRLAGVRRSGGLTELTYERQAEVVSIRERPELAEEAAKWFAGKWGIAEEEYLGSMEESLSGAAVPRWYLAVEGGRIIGGAGVIENDFHERRDLRPNVCALYVEEDRRSRGIAGLLLERVCRDMADIGAGALYLITDHTSFYERYGWEFMCMVRCDDGGTARMYVRRLGGGKNGAAHNSR